jgi:hypothetical protein
MDLRTCINSVRGTKLDESTLVALRAIRCRGVTLLDSQGLLKRGNNLCRVQVGWIR